MDIKQFNESFKSAKTVGELKTLVYNWERYKQEWKRNVKNQGCEMELKMIAGDEAVEFYKNTDISFELLKGVLLRGVTVEDLNHLKNIYSDEVSDTVTFDEFVNLAVMCSADNFKINKSILEEI